MGDDALLPIGLFIAGLVLVFHLLHVVWMREQVKKDLRQRGAAPIQVRWCPYPFGYWAVFYPTACAFRAMFVDATGCIQTGRCVVHTWFHSVYWVRDDLRYLDRDLPAIWRSLSFVGAAFFAWFGLMHLWSGTLVLPQLKAGYHAPPVWHGWRVALLALASLCCAANLLMNSLFRRARETTERHWMLSARGIAVVGWILFFAAFALALREDLVVGN